MRAVRFLGHYRKITIIAYVALFLSTGAQLLVPQMVQNIIDAVTQGMTAQQLAAAPADVQAAALSQLGMTAAEMNQIIANPLAPGY